LISAVRVSYHEIDDIVGLIDSVSAVPDTETSAKPRLSYDSGVAVVRVACANIRKEPSSLAELVTQALFMDRLKLIAKKGTWYEVRVVSQHDYPGWVEQGLAETPVLDLSASDMKAETLVVVCRGTRVFPADTAAGDSGISLLVGTYLQTVLQESGRAKVLLPSGDGWVDTDKCARLSVLRQLRDSALRSSVVRWAKSFIGVPYKWGGITQYGLDCSGLVYLCYRLNGMLLERDAIPQYNAGNKVGEDGLQSGDLVYFTTYKPGASHTGIYIGGGCFTQAGSSKGVVEARLSSRHWRDRYFGAVSYVPTRPAAADCGKPHSMPESSQAGDGRPEKE
jgi:hypothetical protein